MLQTNKTCSKFSLASYKSSVGYHNLRTGLQAMKRKCDRSFVQTRNVAGILLRGSQEEFLGTEVPHRGPEAETLTLLYLRPSGPQARDSSRK